MSNPTPVFMILFWIITGACTSAKKAQDKPIVWENSYAISTHYEPKIGELVVKISLQDGVHAYADRETVGKPVRLEIKEVNGYKAIGAALIPEGTKKGRPGLKDSYVIEHPFEIKQRLQKGAGPGQATLYLQVCSDTQCDRPRAHEVNF